MSTGAGPVTYYSSLSGASRGSSARSGGPTRAQSAQAEKEQQFLELRDALAAIMDIHKVEFPPLHPPVILPPPPPDEKSFHQRREQEQMAGISLFKRSLRKEAKARAEALAIQDIDAEKRILVEEHQRAQTEANEAWARLCDNDPQTVIATVDQAFEDNRAPAAPVDVGGSTLSLVMLAPSLNEIPERMPDITPSGKPTTKKMTKAIRADTYMTLICGHLMATIKEALAVAVGISHIKAVVVREMDPDVYGEVRMEALLAALYARENLARVQWQTATSPEIVQQAADELQWQLKGRPPELKALDLDDQPDLKGFVRAIDEKVR